MLRRSSNSKIIYVPLTAKKYYYKLNSGFYNSFNEQKLHEFKAVDGDYYVKLDFGLGLVSIKRDVLIAITTKNVLLKFQHWFKLNVFYHDNCKNNNSPDNLILKYPMCGICSRFPGFRSIPGFSRYQINKKGEVFSNAVGRLISSYRDQNGYIMFGMTPDLGKRTIIGQHRLLALSFLDYPHNVSILDVNHKDGVKDNNTLENLEWVSRKVNCDHAYSTGLRTDNVEVLVKNVFTNQVFSFYSIEDCARKLKIDGETIRLRLKSRGCKVYYPGILIKKKSDSTAWADIKNPINAVLQTNQPVIYSVKNIITGEIVKIKSLKNVADFLNVKSSTLYYYSLKDKKRFVYKSFIIELEDLEQIAKSIFTVM